LKKPHWLFQNATVLLQQALSIQTLKLLNH